MANVVAQRRDTGPRGLAGGDAGACGADSVKRASGEWQSGTTPVSTRLARGDVLQVATPGGGGFGVRKTLPHTVFAYGSNLDPIQLWERCPRAHVRAQAVLRDHVLAFTRFSEVRQCGVADVVAQPGAQVRGLLLELDDADLAALDDYEGHPDAYCRRAMTVHLWSGDEPHVAWVYQVVDKTPGIGAGHVYSWQIERGLMRLG